MKHEQDFAARLIAFLPNLRRFAIALTRSADMADDMVQTACERALLHRQAFDPATRFDAWMFRILRNLWIDQLRRNRTAGPKEDIDDHPDLATANAEQALLARFELGDVARAIDLLSEDQREVILLVCVEDLSYRDTAEVLGIPIGTVMSRLARARINIARASGITGPHDRSSPQGELKP